MYQPSSLADHEYEQHSPDASSYGLGPAFGHGRHGLSRRGLGKRDRYMAHRRLGKRDDVQSWPPPANHTYTLNATACANMNDGGLPYPSVTLDDWGDWKDQVIAGADPSRGPGYNAMTACTSSPLCCVGYALASGMVFSPEFWQSTASMSDAIINSMISEGKRAFTKSAVRTFIGKKSKRASCSYTSTYTVCGPPGIPILVGWNAAGNVPRYECRNWNVDDINEGAKQIAESCANSCEVLQWYFDWWKYYRVGDSGASNNIPYWDDGEQYSFYQDYCGTGYIASKDPKYFGGTVDNSGSVPVYSSGYTYPSGMQYARHPKCWPGRNIPLCRSFSILSQSTCEAVPGVPAVNYTTATKTTSRTKTSTTRTATTTFTRTSTTSFTRTTSRSATNTLTKTRTSTTSWTKGTPLSGICNGTSVKAELQYLDGYCSNVISDSYSVTNSPVDCFAACCDQKGSRPPFVFNYIESGAIRYCTCGGANVACASYVNQKPWRVYGVVAT